MSDKNQQDIQLKKLPKTGKSLPMDDNGEVNGKISPENLVFVHATDFAPIVGKDGKLKILSANDATEEKIPRGTNHYTLNHHVTDNNGGSWGDVNYRVLIPGSKMIEQNGNPDNLTSYDTFWNKSNEVPEGSTLIHPPGMKPNYPPEIAKGLHFIEEGKDVNGRELTDQAVQNMGYSLISGGSTSSGTPGFDSKTEELASDLGATSVPGGEHWTDEYTYIKANQNTGQLGGAQALLHNFGNNDPEMYGRMPRELRQQLWKELLSGAENISPEKVNFDYDKDLNADAKRYQMTTDEKISEKEADQKMRKQEVERAKSNAKKIKSMANNELLGRRKNQEMLEDIRESQKMIEDEKKQKGQKQSAGEGGRTPSPTIPRPASVKRAPPAETADKLRPADQRQATVPLKTPKSEDTTKPTDKGVSQPQTAAGAPVAPEGSIPDQTSTPTIPHEKELDTKRALERAKKSQIQTPLLGAGGVGQDNTEKLPKRTEEQTPQDQTDDRQLPDDAKRQTPKTATKGADSKKSAKGFKQRWQKLKAAQRKLKKPSKADVKKLVSSVTSPVFMLTLGLAAVKDIIDLFSLGTIGTIVNVAVTMAFTAILLFQGSSMKKMKKRWIRYGIAALAEFIPFVSILPFWSGSVIWDKLSKK